MTEHYEPVVRTTGTPAEPSTAEVDAQWIARTIGKADAWYTTDAWSKGETSTSQHVSARDLVNPDEIMRLSQTKMILLQQGQRPAVVEKLRYYDDPEFKGLFDAT